MADDPSVANEQPSDQPPVVALIRREDIAGSPYEMTPDGLELIKRFAREGDSNNGIAERLGISRDALRALRHRQPQVDEALVHGRAIFERALVDKLTSKALAGDTVALLFLLKAKCGWREGTERDGGGPHVAVQINLPGPAATVADYLAAINVAASDALPPDGEEPQ